jgi:Zn finger protein HypA/HybF involved in hydrogenase expression
MVRKILGEETTCPKCHDALNMDINIGDNHLYDVCPGCGFKRKKTMSGQEVKISPIREC